MTDIELLTNIFNSLTNISDLLIITLPILIFIGGCLFGALLLQAFSFWKW